MDTTTGRLTLSRGESRTAHLTVRTRTQSGVMRHLPGIVAAALLVGGGIVQAAPAVPVHGVYETEAGAEHTLYAVVREDEEATRWMADGRRVVHVLVTHEADSLNRGTTSHYFAFNPETLRKRKQLRVDALRFAPQGGYIHIDDKEYAVTEILITLTDGEEWGVREVKLSRTGFIPPPFKGKLRPTFQPSMPMGPKARSWSRSSTCLRESGNLTYSINARRMISGDVLKYLKWFFILRP